ncbi:MAG: hypothetical protein K9H49_16545 [Bacteroidales bacterium]|nr:hypothetical protein [Bacteroidales bacterium]MCF8391772.1 hypothetical protein [Bacteroidales bacterium]
MKHAKNESGFLQKVWNFIKRCCIAIVSGIPRQKVELKPPGKTSVYTHPKEKKAESEKRYHKPVAKPVVEKQTLLKEKKKVRGGLAK